MATIWGSATGSNSNRVNVWIEWREGTIDYANNRSYVYAGFYAQTKLDKTSTTYDNNGNFDFRVNGVSVLDIKKGPINFRDASPHNRPLNTLGTWEGWQNRDGNGNANIRFDGNFSLSSSYISGGSANGTVSLSTIKTNAGTPSNLRLSLNIFENSVALSWDAAPPGVNNAIIGYSVYYRLNDGAEKEIPDTGPALNRTLNTSGFARGAKLYFRVKALSKQATDNLVSEWSLPAIKNSGPNPPTNVGTTKTCYAPGEAIRVTLSSAGDPDGNLKGFQVARTDGGAIVGSNDSPAATFVDVSTSEGVWTPGASYALRVRAVDALGAESDWVSVPPVMVGLPAFVRVNGDFKRAVSMQVYVSGVGFRPVKSMKIAATQGPVNKTVF